MKSVIKYEVNIVLKISVMFRNIGNFFERTEIEVLIEKEDKIVLKDDDFTVVTKSPARPVQELNRPIIYSYAGHSTYGTCIQYKLYSTEEKSLEEIQQEIFAHIEEKYGDFIKINLDFIK